MSTLVSLIAFGIWIYLLGFRGQFWRSTPVLANRIPSGNAKVCAVVPARDEAKAIKRALTSLLAQDYTSVSGGDLSIVLVDDNSTDGTGEIAGALATADPRLTIVRGQPLQPGWSGKVWAVAQGLAHEKAMHADYVLLTDADIEHSREHLSALVAKAEADELDLVFEMVRLNCDTPAERALIPAYVFFFQLLYPFTWAADPAKTLAAAAGGTMLVSRAALTRIDGVNRTKDDLIDDCALAHQIKSKSGKIWLGHAEKAISLRVYSEASEIWNMVARTAYVQLKCSPVILGSTMLGMALVYLAPVIVAFTAHGVPLILGIATWLMMALAFQPTLRRFDRSRLWGFALPLISLFYLGATIASAVRHYSGRGGGWKNRVYPPAKTTI